MPRAEKKNVVCPECSKDVELVLDKESEEYEGRCADCGLNVGAVYVRSRYQRAIKKLEDGEAPAPRKRSWPFPEF